MQQNLTVLSEERLARDQLAHMERMRRQAAKNREARKRQAEREARRQAKRDLAAAEREIARLWPKYDKALKHPQMPDLEKLDAQLHRAIGAKRSAQRRLSA